MKKYLEKVPTKTLKSQIRSIILGRALTWSVTWFAIMIQPETELSSTTPPWHLHQFFLACKKNRFWQIIYFHKANARDIKPVHQT